jgi:hypothetical protein
MRLQDFPQDYFKDFPQDFPQDVLKYRSQLKTGGSREKSLHWWVNLLLAYKCQSG